MEGEKKQPQQVKKKTHILGSLWLHQQCSALHSLWACNYSTEPPQGKASHG